MPLKRIKTIASSSPTNSLGLDICWHHFAIEMVLNNKDTRGKKSNRCAHKNRNKKWQVLQVKHKKNKINDNGQASSIKLGEIMCSSATCSASVYYIRSYVNLFGAQLLIAPLLTSIDFAFLLCICFCIQNITCLSGHFYYMPRAML